MAIGAEQILAFRFARSGLAERDGRTLAQAAACPASDFARDAALTALAARSSEVTREGFTAAVDAGDVVLAHVIRGAIHAVAPGDHALYGKALVARDDDEVAAQLGEQVKRLAAEHGFSPGAALDEVTEATRAALEERGALDKNALHEELRHRVGDELLPWCRGCGSHHVAPMMWRYATVKGGVRLDGERRYVLGSPGRAPAASEAVRRFLRFYGPAKPGDFADWAGLAKPHAQRLWTQVERDLAEVDGAWVMGDDVAELESPPSARGVRLLPPGDPYVHKVNRPLLAPGADLRKRFFRPVASPGVVVQDGRLAGLWRLQRKGRKAELTVEALTKLRKGDLEEEGRRVAELRGASDVRIGVA